MILEWGTHDTTVITIAAAAIALACCFCSVAFARRRRGGKHHDGNWILGSPSGADRRRGRKKGRTRRGGSRTTGAPLSPRSADVDDAEIAADDASTASAGDRTLLSTFVAVLSEGLILRLHGPGGKSKEITLWLDRDELVWCSNRSLTRRWHKVPLRAVQFVEVGRFDTAGGGGGGSGSSSPASTADADRCLSLVMKNSSFNLEASSTIEREAMAQGFSMLIMALRQK